MAGGFEEDTFAKDKPQEQSLKQDASGKNNSSGMPKMQNSNLQDVRDILCKNAAPCCISKCRKDDLECCRFSGNAHIACAGNDLGMKMPARNSKNINTIGFQGILAKPRTFPFSHRRHKVPEFSLPFASYWCVMLATLWNNLHFPAPCSPARKLRNHSYGCCNHFLKRRILKFHRRRQYHRYHVQKSISTNLFYRALKSYIKLAYLGMTWRRKRMVTKVFYTKHTRKIAKRSRGKKVKRARKNWDLEKSTLSTPQVKMKNYLDDCIIVEEAHTKGLERKRSLDLQDLNLLTPEVKIAAYQDDCILTDKTFHTEEADIKSEQPPVRNSEGNNYENRDVRLHGLRHLHLRNAGDIAAAGFYLNGSGLLQCNGCRRAWSPAEVSNDPYGQDLHYSWCRYLLSRHGARNNLPRQIASDGMVSDDARDPPGQQSIYIPPGDTRSESYRLSTFEHFPVACPISRKSLAKCGFFFTGFYDRVKCFACGRTVERWEETDNPAELRWHKPDCPFPRGGSCGNVPVNDLFERLHTNPITRQQQAQQQMEQVLTQTDPNSGAVLRTVRYPADLPQRIRQSGGTFEIGPGNSVIIQSGPGRQPASVVNIGNSSAPAPTRRWRMANVVSADHKRFLTNLHLNRELDRLTSFARWPVSRPNVSPALLAKSGFFYLGDMDRTQCFSCGGVLRNWTIEDDPQEEHQTHFQRCHLVQGIEARNVPIPQIAESAEDRIRLYPCRYPASPHMRHDATRLGTFDDRWPADRVRATPENISQAGFFFLGERDRAKCWYCNGGLQNWEYEDDPWEEHAKWFPNCQFLLQSKGQAFVYRHLAMNPHLARPIIARQEGSTIDPAPPSGEVVAPLDIPPSGPEVRPPSPPPVIVDPREELRKKKERVERIAKSSEICKNVIAMGFSEDVVKQLLEERIDAGNEANPEDIYESTSALLDDVMKKEEEVRREAEEEEARSQASMMSSVPSGFSTNLSSLTSSVGPAPGSGRYNVSFYDEDEPMDDIELYGSMAGPLSMLSAASGNSGTGAPAEGKHSEKNEGAKESLQEQLQKIEEERLCKICFTNVADMVYIPCGHMCCCLECTQAIRQCPICRKKIEKAIKTYSS